MNSIWWCPEPRDGEVVPDHPPVDLTSYIVSGSFTAAGSRQAMTAAMRYDEQRAAALAAGFTEQQWDEQLAMATRWGRTLLHRIDVPDTALRLLLEFGEPIEPVQAERRRSMKRLRAAGILRDDPG